jgi:hypothetical protein
VGKRGGETDKADRKINRNAENPYDRFLGKTRRLEVHEPRVWQAGVVQSPLAPSAATAHENVTSFQEP